MVFFVLAGLTVFGVLLAPNLVLKVKARHRAVEEQTLQRIHEGLVRCIERQQTIPTATNWWSSLQSQASIDSTGASRVHTAFAADTNTARVFLVDPGLPSGILPYVQNATGLTGTQTNLFSDRARVMLVSNTKRSLTLPVASGTPSSNAFHALWNWAYDANTQAPPSGWPADWTRNGEFLHVHRINLANEFHRVTCRNLRYGIGETNTPTNLVTSTTVFSFLRGTRLTLAKTDGTLKRIHIVNRDIPFDFGGTNSTSAIGWWKFSEGSGSVATNAGTLGQSANGAYTNGVTLGVPGPQPPTYSGYTTNNTAISLDGTNDYVKGTNGLLNNVSGFTIAGWIYPATATFKYLDLFGQEGIAQIGFTVADKLELRCADETKKLHYTYPFATGEWHHITGVGDGVNLYLYVDGVEAAWRTYATTNYGSNANSFNIGGNVFGSGQYFPGVIDEVIVYDRALNAIEVSLLYQGQAF